MNSSNVLPDDNSNPSQHDDRPRRAASCGAWIRRCRGCGYRYSADDTANGVVNCPDCSMPRGRCELSPVPGRSRCRLHGGKSLAGVSSPTYRGRGYSKYLPDTMRNDYAAALRNPDLLSLNREIAIIESRMAVIMRQMTSEGGASAAWRHADLAMRSLISVLQSSPPDPAKQADALRKLDTVIKQGYDEVKLWVDLIDLIETKRRLTETEQKRLTAAKMLVAVPQAMLLFDRLVNAVVENVSDQRQLALIQREWDRAFTTASVPALRSGTRDEQSDGATVAESARGSDDSADL